MSRIYSCIEAARLLGCHAWQVRRVDPKGTRVGQYRAYTESDLERLRKLLQEALYLRPPAGEGAK
jgi:hypothetical protein